MSAMSNTLSYFSHVTGKPRHLVGVEYHRLTCPPDNNITLQVPSYHFYPLEIRHQQEKTGQISMQSLATTTWLLTVNISH
jgi:hypothetical protein